MQSAGPPALSLEPQGVQRRLRAAPRRGVAIIGLGSLLALAGCFVDQVSGTDTNATTGPTSIGATTTSAGATSSVSKTGTTAPESSTSDATTSGSSTTGPEPEVLIIDVEDGLNDALQDPDLSVKVAFGWVTLNSPEHYGALRFAIPEIPQGATIVAAEFLVYVDGTDVDSPRLEIYGELAPNPPIFAVDPENISARPKTLASVVWSADDVGDGWVQSPSIVSVIQELIDQPMWMPNQHIVLLLDATNQASNLAPFEFRQYDNSPDFAPRLGIQWIDGSAP